jgi:tetratricopeptide (TPR) repeat protein/DNA-binding CsgD family transcriptional regulator
LYYHDDREKALKYRLEAYELSKQITDYPQAYRRMAEITSVLANEYFLQKDFVTARKFLKEALAVCRNRSLFVSEAYCYSINAEILKLEKNYDSAIHYSKKAIDLRTSVGDHTRLHDSYGLLGEMYMEKRNYKEAVKNLAKAVELTREMNSLFFQYRWLPPLAKAYAGLGDKDLAYRIMSEYQALSDSVLNEQKIKAITELETKYETAKKQQEIESLKKDQALQEQVNLNQRMVFAGIVIILVISGMAYYFRAKAKEQENLRLTERVDAQNRELSTISLLVSKKNEAFQSLKEKLSNVGNGTSGDSLKSIVKDIDKEIDFDADWDTFKYHFEKVHQGFFYKLTETAPSLTSKEQRYCAYFKSNLSTKEIAQLTNTSVRGVQQARYRINQKLAEGNTSLVEFLQKS